MKSLVLKGSIAVLVLAIGCGLLLHAAAEPQKAEEPAAKPGARVQVVKEVLDAGDVVRGKEAKATFLLKNVGDQELKILSAKPSCGCTVAAFDATVPVGGIGKVSTSLKTDSFSGPIEKLVTVTTNDSAQPTLTLRIKANVVVSVAVLPRPGLFLPAGMEWEFAGKLIVRKDPAETGELKITDVSTTVPWLIVKPRRVTAAEPAVAELPEALPGDWVLDVSVGDDAPKTSGRYDVKFKTGLTREAEVSVPVSVVLESPMRVMPAALTLPAGKEATGSLSAAVRPGLGKATVTATATPAAFSVRVQPDGERRYKATVHWKGDGDSAPTDGSVVFKVGDESVTVPVHVDVAKGATGS